MNIIVTGASRGIGYELIKCLAARPGNNLFAISRNEAKLKVLKQDCINQGFGSVVNIMAFDLSKIDLITSNLVPTLSKHWDKVDILINNAGLMINKSYEQIARSELQQVIDLNFTAPFFLIQSLIKLLNNSDNPHIVNISSMGGLTGTVKFSGLSAYSSTKGALCVLTECLAEEYRETGIRFNCLALGAVQTEMLEEAFPNYKAPVSAKEMAEFIADFAISGNKYFNGKILPISLSTP